MMRHFATICIVAIVLGLTTACGTVDTAGPVADEWPDEALTPWQKLESPVSPAPTGWREGSDEAPRQWSARGGIFEVGFLIYVHGLTKVDGARCEHRPTCSVYSYRAVQKHGAFLGMMLGVDRLMRSNQSSIHRRLPTHSIQEGSMYYYDPVEANDFFL